MSGTVAGRTPVSHGSKAVLKKLVRALPPVRWSASLLRDTYEQVRSFHEFHRFVRLSREVTPRFELRWADRWLCMHDRSNTFVPDAHYTYHPAWAARVLSRLMPEEHVDISSATSFVTMISAFIPTRYYEFRPPKIELENLTVGSADLTQLPFADNSLASVSCMHTIEHLGLGRYGDPMDPEADVRGIQELKRVVAPGGSLLFAVPIGRARIRFNAHRVYSYNLIMRHFSGFMLNEFALISSKRREGSLIPNATREQADDEREGCGCFWFIKDRPRGGESHA